jgi:hypothetical protein
MMNTIKCLKIKKARAGSAMRSRRVGVCTSTTITPPERYEHYCVTDAIPHWAYYEKAHHFFAPPLII